MTTPPTLQVPERGRRRILLSRPQTVAVLLSAIIFALAFPPFHLVVPALVCLAPMAVAVAHQADRRGSAWEAARIGGWFGLIGYGFTLYWIAVALSLYTKLAIAGYLGSLVWLAPFVGLATLALFVIRRGTKLPLAILLPVVWVTLELVFNYLSDLSFPWLPLGLSMARTPVLAQMADLSGVRGVSFWIAAINGLVADAWMLRRHVGAVRWRMLGVLGIIAVAELYGGWRMASLPLAPLARVSVIQPNIPEEVKLTVSDAERTSHVGLLASLTRRELQRSTPALVVWPEAALDSFLWHYPNWIDSLQAAVSAKPTPLIVGFLDSSSPLTQPFHYYNAALITDPSGRLSTQAPYHKQFLVPIVERVPFLNPDWFRGVNYFGGFGRGTSDTPFVTPLGKAGVLICYESIYPQLSRAYAEHGAVLLVNITNDAWFQRSLAPYQHFAHLALRSIETRLPAVRAANTGISGYIDPLGRVREATPIFTQYTGTYDVQRAVTGPTLYVRVGDWVGTACLIATLVLLLTAFVRTRRARERFEAQQ